jgi:hypothetical protein
MKLIRGRGCLLLLRLESSEDDLIEPCRNLGKRVEKPWGCSYFYDHLRDLYAYKLVHKTCAFAPLESLHLNIST